MILAAQLAVGAILQAVATMPAANEETCCSLAAFGRRLVSGDVVGLEASSAAAASLLGALMQVMEPLAWLVSGEREARRRNQRTSDISPQSREQPRRRSDDDQGRSDFARSKSAECVVTHLQRSLLALFQGVASVITPRDPGNGLSEISNSRPSSLALQAVLLYPVRVGTLGACSGPISSASAISTNSGADVAQGCLKQWHRLHSLLLSLVSVEKGDTAVGCETVVPYLLPQLSTFAVTRSGGPSAISGEFRALMNDITVSLMQPSSTPSPVDKKSRQLCEKNAVDSDHDKLPATGEHRGQLTSHCCATACAL
jgi:hypothetical protein